MTRREQYLPDHRLRGGMYQETSGRSDNDQYSSVHGSDMTHSDLTVTVLGMPGRVYEYIVARNPFQERVVSKRFI